MNWFETICDKLVTEMEVPGNYGWFHIMMLSIIIFLTVVLCIAGRNWSDKAFRRFILLCWIINMIGEAYVVLAFSFQNVDGVANWDYAWYMFPFQFCSSPAYVLPFVAFLKDGKVRDAFIAFVGTFSFFGGLAVMLYPNDVFMYIAGINIQTMLHHGMQLMLGIFVMIHQRRKLTHSFFFRGIFVFSGLVIIAMVLNLGVYEIFQNLGMDDNFNMFFISPYFDCTLPVLSLFWGVVPYPAFLAIYIFGFSIIAALMYYIQRAIILKFTGISPHILRVNQYRPISAKARNTANE